MSDDFNFVDDPQDIPEEAGYTQLAYKANGEESDVDNPSAYTKTLEEHDSGERYFYIKCFNGSLLDPWGLYFGRESSIKTEYRKVSKKTFDYFSTYLQRRNSLFLTRAQRSFLND